MSEQVISKAIREVVIEWLKDDIASAKESDPDVGIYRNEDLVDAFKHLIGYMSEELNEVWFSEDGPASCPWCKSKNISTNEALTNRKERLFHHSGCLDCGAMGPEVGANSDRTADEAWNRRPSPWISVKDRLPDDHRPAYFVVLEDGRFEKGFADFTVPDNKFSCWIVDGAEAKTVTHWWLPPYLEDGE